MRYIVIVLVSLIGGALLAWTSSQEKKSPGLKPLILSSEVVSTILVALGFIGPLSLGFVLGGLTGTVISMVSLITFSRIFKLVLN